MNLWSLWQYLYWIIGAVGITGVIALWIFAPAAMQILLKIVYVVLHELLATRFGCAILAAVVVALGVNYMRGKLDAEHYAADTAQFEERQKARDAQIAADTREAVLKEQADLKTSFSTIDTDQKVFTDALPIAPPLPADNPFRLGNDACQLRIIAGLAPCGPAGTHGVPGAGHKAAHAGHRPRQRLPQADPGPPRQAPQGAPQH